MTTMTIRKNVNSNVTRTNGDSNRCAARRIVKDARNAPMTTTTTLAVMTPAAVVAAAVAARVVEGDVTTKRAGNLKGRHAPRRIVAVVQNAPMTTEIMMMKIIMK